MTSTRVALGFILLGSALLLAVGAASGGCSGSKTLDAREAADALADEFGDWLSFENGTDESGAPPEGHPDDGSFAQIQQFSAPFAFGTPNPPYIEAYGQQFEVRLQAWGDTANIIGAIAQVGQANKDDVAPGFIRIQPVTIEPISGEVVLLATVTKIDRLVGNAFHVALALLTPNGAGSYTDWNFVTLPETGDTTRVAQCTCPEATVEFIHDYLADDNFNNWSTDGRCNDPSMIEEAACSRWPSCFLGTNTNHDPEGDPLAFPDGTRWTPYWSADPLENDDCEQEIRCP